MNIGISYSGFYQEPFETFVDISMQNGFAWFEFIPDQDPNLYSQLSASRITELVRLKTANNLTYSVHNVFYDVNLLSIEPHVAGFAFDITEKIMAFSRAIGATSVTVHPGYMFPGWRRDERQGRKFWENALTVLKRLAELSAKYGVPVLLENGAYCLTTMTGDRRIPLHVGVTSEEMSRLIMLAPQEIGVTLDIGKAAQSGEELSAWRRSCGERLSQIQIDSDRHLEGDGNWIAQVMTTNPDRMRILIEAPLRLAVVIRQKLEALGSAVVHR